MDKTQNKKNQSGRKLLVYPMLLMLFAGSLWLIFSPSDDTLKASGYNTEVPQPADQKIESDKQKAYETARFEESRQERQKQVENLASMFDAYEQQTASIDEPTVEQPRGNAIESSSSAYRQITRTLDDFYEVPKEDADKIEMQKRLDELTAQLEQQTKKPELPDPMQMMERSYQLAAKYMPGSQNLSTLTSDPVPDPPKPTERNGKALMNPVGQVCVNPVSALVQPQSDSAFMVDYSAERNREFHTAVDVECNAERNTIRAAICDNATITDGQAVRLRLLEPIKVGTTILPRNSVVTAMGKISGERLYLTISSLETAGTILSVDLSVYDSDGQQGVFIPNSMEVNAAKEIAANMGSSLGTGVSITNQGAGDQLLSELGKGVIQGVSQYASKKIREVRVHLKAGYQLLLFQSKN